MCWVCLEKPVKKVAEEDIAVYKIFTLKRDVPGGLTIITSPIYKLDWQLGTTYHEEINLLEDLQGYVIYEGLHSCMGHPIPSYTLWKLNDRAVMFRGRFEIQEALKCTIPKGSTYYVNTDGLVVSDTLIVDDTECNRRLLSRAKVTL
jgi:hypothetical protein